MASGSDAINQSNSGASAQQMQVGHSQSVTEQAMQQAAGARALHQQRAMAVESKQGTEHLFELKTTNRTENVFVAFSPEHNEAGRVLVYPGTFHEFPVSSQVARSNMYLTYATVYETDRGVEYGEREKYVVPTEQDTSLILTGTKVAHAIRLEQPWVDRQGDHWLERNAFKLMEAPTLQQDAGWLRDVLFKLPPKQQVPVLQDLAAKLDRDAKVFDAFKLITKEARMNDLQQLMELCRSLPRTEASGRVLGLMCLDNPTASHPACAPLSLVQHLMELCRSLPRSEDSGRVLGLMCLDNPTAAGLVAGEAMAAIRAAKKADRDTTQGSIAQLSLATRGLALAPRI